MQCFYMLVYFVVLYLVVKPFANVTIAAEILIADAIFENLFFGHWPVGAGLEKACLHHITEG